MLPNHFTSRAALIQSQVRIEFGPSKINLFRTNFFLFLTIPNAF